METWRIIYRAAAPLLPTKGLVALRYALLSDDPQLIQGATMTPPELQCVADWPVEGACLIGYCGWKGSDLNTVADVSEFFARVCFDLDTKLEEPAVCRHLLNWFDETPRGEMRSLLLTEVQRTLAERELTVLGFVTNTI